MVKGKKREPYYLKKKTKTIANHQKVIRKYLNHLLNILWNCYFFITTNVLKMIPAKSQNRNTKPSKDTKSPPNLCRKNAGNNWCDAVQILGNFDKGNKNSRNVKKSSKGISFTNVTKYIAMDCEMVGIGPDGQNDMLARVSLVNQKGEVLLDKYIKPTEPVSDYRTEVSGIRPHNIECGEDFNKVQDEVVNIIQGNILVGHSIKKDLAVLYINHPYKYIRDTAKYRPLAKLISNGATPSLKRISKSILGLDIQDGEHDSVEDAKATMAIYNCLSADWEKYIKKLANRQKGNHNKHGYSHGRKT